MDRSSHRAGDYPTESAGWGIDQKVSSFEFDLLIHLMALRANPINLITVHT
jgi:hypothetical protein